MAKVRAVVFDVYGTIATINDKRNPFGKLLQIGETQGRLRTPQDRVTLMSKAVDLGEAASLLGISLAAHQFEELEEDLRAELASITLFPEVLNTIRSIQNRGIKIGLCSNLAAAYALPITELLPMQLDAYTWSFEAKSLKPNRSIYESVCRSLKCAPHQVLMIGDTQEADVDGPRLYGMQSIRLNRAVKHDTADSVSTLSGLLKLL
ncbi:MAG: HAD family hydrolase [Pseudomonadota bacterium]